jgi:hypothetical protein
MLARRAAGDRAHPLPDAGVDGAEVVVPGRYVGGHGGAGVGVRPHGAWDEEQHGFRPVRCLIVLLRIVY